MSVDRWSDGVHSSLVFDESHPRPYVAPELPARLRARIECYGVAADGRLFRGLNLPARCGRVGARSDSVFPAACVRLYVAQRGCAVSRWDDVDRIDWTSTLSSALIGAVDGGALRASEALLLDHLLDDADTGRAAASPLPPARCTSPT